MTEYIVKVSIIIPHWNGIDILSEYQLIIWACGADYQSGDTDVTFTTNDKEQRNSPGYCK